jgi:imidazolonepropionase-like amidohydrolase
VCAAGTDTVEHGWYMTEQNCETLIRHSVYLVPTVSNVWAIVERGPEHRMPWAAMIASEERDILDRLRMAIEMGVKVAMGTDVGGNVAHRYGDNAKELEIYVDCGMSPMGAVMAGTLEAARAIHRDEFVGSIEPGKLADLIVVDGDPLSDIGLTRTGVAAVVQGGVVVRDDLGHFDGLRALRVTEQAW